MKINTSRLVRNKAESIFSEIVTTRSWNAMHGGVYVPITEITQPNPFLKGADRDIETISGLKLTKINPAYMTRQISELAELQNHISFHITSLKPIRPANKADEWELTVLKGFEENPEPFLQNTNINSVPYYRYMAPLITQTSCLRCHSEQGYKEGDVRGGISVSFRDDVYKIADAKQTAALGIIHIIVLFLGIIGLKYYKRMSSKFLLELSVKNDKLEENQLYQNQLNKDLKEINATKDKFFSIIAHDLKGPFNSILGFSNLLLEDFQNLPDEQKHEMVHIISESASNSYNLLENLLMWSRAQIGKIKYNPVKIDIKELIDSLISLYKGQSKNKEIIIKNNIQESFELISDKNIIETILRNLVSNAIKYTKKGGAITLDCVVLSNNKASKITVTDNGVGMTEKNLSELFKVDNNNSTDGTEKEKGTGLGLILCKELVKVIGGEIEVESKEGFGSEFKFTIPQNRT
jgi:signal transduction histidine kinase